LPPEALPAAAVLAWPGKRRAMWARSSTFLSGLAEETINIYIIIKVVRSALVSTRIRNVSRNLMKIFLLFVLRENELGKFAMK
jgi:hypothetical protein